MRERTQPTHILKIAVPLDLAEPLPDYDVVKQALDVCLAVSRAAFDSKICDAIEVSYDECATSR